MKKMHGKFSKILYISLIILAQANGSIWEKKTYLLSLSFYWWFMRLAPMQVQGFSNDNVLHITKHCILFLCIALNHSLLTIITFSHIRQKLYRQVVLQWKTKNCIFANCCKIVQVKNIQMIPNVKLIKTKFWIDRLIARKMSIVHHTYIYF